MVFSGILSRTERWVCKFKILLSEWETTGQEFEGLMVDIQPPVERVFSGKGRTKSLVLLETNFLLTFIVTSTNQERERGF